jgi:hypothetical protein
MDRELAESSTERLVLLVRKSLPVNDQDLMLEKRRMQRLEEPVGDGRAEIHLVYDRAERGGDRGHP